jgi:hypothetical protein
MNAIMTYTRCQSRCVLQSASSMTLKMIYSALLSGKMEQPFYQFNALPKSFLTPTEIMHFEW